MMAARVGDMHTCPDGDRYRAACRRTNQRPKRADRPDPATCPWQGWALFAPVLARRIRF